MKTQGKEIGYTLCWTNDDIKMAHLTCSPKQLHTEPDNQMKVKFTCRL